MDIATLHSLYRTGKSTPSAIVEEIYSRIDVDGLSPVWISLVPKEQALSRARMLESKSHRTDLPLFGIPFAVKDNIDVAALPTTAGCPAFAYTPKVSATVVQCLERTGAILIGKTNMDQFATGLVGVRSPYGICSSVFDKRYISGGSSSGSAIAVASGLVSFSLGTDTAGSGRVPAAFNNLVGLKPTRGRLSTTGVVPACKTLDCVSIFAETCADASLIFQAASSYDPSDPYSRTPAPGNGASPWCGNSFRFGIPNLETMQYFGDKESAKCFQAAVDGLSSLGGEAIEIDFAPFQAVADLLYSGPWVAERYAAIAQFMEANSADTHPVVHKIISGAARYSAIDTFQAMYRLQQLRREISQTWREADLLLLPTAPRTYAIEEVLAAPYERNKELGYYTNFVNLLDLAAVAVPAGFKPNGLPFGVSLISHAFTDEALLPLADRLHRISTTTLGGSIRQLAEAPTLNVPSPPPGCLLVAVVGAHLFGQPLNWQLTDRGGRLCYTTHTMPDYRFYALSNTSPAKPGLIHTPGFQGPGIEVEVWALPEDTVGSFVDGVQPPLTIGTIHLLNGQHVKGFLSEPAALKEATEITHMGGWRNYLSNKV